MSTTMLANLINPEVMADMISAELPAQLRATGFYKVDDTLTATPGNTITVPRWAYIGAAADLAEGANGEVTQMTSTEVKYTVKKAVKNVELTDEAVLSGYGDPVGECQRQLRMSIADKVDNDGMALLEALTSETPGVQYSTATGDIGYDAVVDALDLMPTEEQGGDMTLLVSKKGIKTLRKDPRFVDRNQGAVLGTGVVGEVAGCKVVICKKLDGLTADRAYIVSPETFTAFIKRDVALETQRDVLAKKTLFSADEHYTVAIEDLTKLVKIEYTPTV